MMIVRHAWLCCLAVGVMSVSAATPEQNVRLDIPARVQWNANYGYCGEVSMISAGLYFGQYCSQYKARAIASPGVSQNNVDSQLLLGVNAVDAADGMHLQSIEWNTDTQKTTSQFLVWVKKQILLGHPVIIGVFMNQYKFYGDKDRKAGDGDYDHIVPVTGIGSKQPWDKSPDRFYSTDTMTFSDNGLWSPNGDPPFDFTLTFGAFDRSRSSANGARSPVYSLNNNKQNYGIAITGVKDLQGDTIPVRLATNLDDEVPEVKDGSSKAPTAMPLVLTATVQIPDQTAACNLYLYSDFDSVPDSQFNAKAANAARVWHIPAGSGATYTAEVNILSNEVAIFRAVRATAP